MQTSVATASASSRVSPRVEYCPSCGIGGCASVDNHERAPVAWPGAPRAAGVRARRAWFLAALTVLAWLPLSVTWAQQPAPVELVIHDDGLSPTQLHLPADQRVELRIRNTRKVPAEFESPKIGREKVVPGGTTLSLWVGPLKAGEYEFFDEFNPGTKGKLIVAPAKGNGSGS